MSLGTIIFYQNGNKFDVFNVITDILHHNLLSFISNYSKSYTQVNVILGTWVTEAMMLRVWGLPLVPLLNVLIAGSLEDI